MATPGPAIETLLYLLDQGFEGDDEHSLIGNLKDVRDEDWAGRGPGSGRSIREIALHAAAAKYVYGNQAFGDATISWAAGLGEVYSAGESVAAGLKILRETHDGFREAVAALGDADLLGPRRLHYGGTAPARFVVVKMIGHDLYHAGEINHLRATLQGDDHWPGQAPRKEGITR